jgi:hypothetical protein
LVPVFRLPVPDPRLPRIRKLLLERDISTALSHTSAYSTLTQQHPRSQSRSFDLQTDLILLPNYFRSSSMAPAEFLPGLGHIDSPAPTSSGLASPSTADLEHATLYQRYELLQRNDIEKTEFINVSTSRMQSTRRLTAIGAAHPLRVPEPAIPNSSLTESAGCARRSLMEE